MQKCRWSQNNLCQVFVVRGTITKVSCNGLKDRSCGKNLDIEDIRDRKPHDCPDPLCILDMSDPTVCQNCPKKPKHALGWGGRRAGAGAPRGNLNRLVHGRTSKLIRTAIEKLARDPELRVFLFLIARAATEGEIPQTTINLIQKVTEAVKDEGVSDES